MSEQSDESHESTVTQSAGAIAIVLILGGLPAVIELILFLSSQGWFGSPLWRLAALEYGAFWTGLLAGWQPRFPPQPATMFVTYSLLHSGPGHLLGNLGALIYLGPALIRHVDALGVVLVWFVSVLGGAVVFAVLARTFSPMVGASGAIFGLAGALVVLRYRADRLLLRLLLIVVGLIVLNVVMYFIENGVVAWQTHLGGFLAGAITGAILRTRDPGALISAKKRRMHSLTSR